MSEAGHSQAFDPPTTEELAALLPQYEIHGFIAQGGMGAVYLGRQAALDRYVAIKVLPPSLSANEDFARRFQTEARAMAKLQHTNIVTIFDFGVTAGGHLYFVMEHVHGETLHEMIQAGRMTQESAISITLQLCDGLANMHEHGLVHRDIKPGNILIDTEGRAKLADFGLARDASEEDAALGTPDYVAPEVLQSDAVVDHRADIYSLGLVIYEMLTGQPPRNRKGPVTAFVAVDPNWDEIITKATQPQAKDRQKSVKDIRHAVAIIASRRRLGPGGAPRMAATPQTGRIEKSSASLVKMMSLIVIAGIGGIWWLTQRPSDAVHSPEPESPATAKSTDHGQIDAVTTSPIIAPGSPAASVATSPTSVEPYSPPPGEPGQVTKLPPEHRDYVNGLVLLPDQRHAATAGYDGLVKLWDLKTGASQTFSAGEVSLQRIAASHDGNYLAVGATDYQLRVLNVNPLTLVTMITRPGRSTLGIDFSKDDNRIVSTSSDNGHSVHIWSWRANPQETYTPVGWKYPASALVMVPDSKDEQFVTTGGTRTSPTDPYDSEFRLGSASKHELQKLLPGLKYGVTCLAMSPDGHWIALASGRLPRVMDFWQMKEVSSLRGHDATVTALKFLAGGQLIITGAQDKTIRIFETSTGKQVWMATAETLCTNWLDVSADETWAVTAGGFRSGTPLEKDLDYAVHLWRLPKSSDLITEEGKIAAAKRNLEQSLTEDAELTDLKSQLDAEWKAERDAAGKQARADLDEKYMNALRGLLQKMSPSQRDVVLNEISRVANHGKAPDAAPADWPPDLARLLGIYLEQIPQLPAKAQAAMAAVAATQASRLGQMIAERESRNDSDGALRARAVLDQLQKRGLPPKAP